MMEPYVVEKGILRVKVPTLTQDDLRFDQACRALLEAPDNPLVVDLASVQVITSTFIGVLAVTYVDAKKAGKDFIIRAPAKVLDVFRLAGFADGSASLEEVPFSAIQ